MLLVLGSGLPGQTRTDTLRFYFAIDKKNPKDIGAIGKIQNTDSVQEIRIIGYADFLHSNSYNQILSEKRAENIRDLLVEKYPGLREKITSCKGLGERFSKGDSVGGEQWWRRADVIVTKKKTLPGRPQKPMSKPADAEKENKTTHLEKLKSGETITLEGLSFIPGRHIVLPNSEPKLEELLDKLKEHADLKIQIQGHVCCTENGRDGLDLDTRKYELSVNRAKAVYQYLIKNGIDKDRLSYRGFGGTRPKVKETSPENEQVNRRVEIMVISGYEKEN